MTFLQIVFGYVIGRVIISMIFIPAYFRGDLFTSYELLQRRFGDRVKSVAAVIFLITRSLADGIRLFATALVISVVTQVPVTVAVLLIGTAMIVYTVRGGVGRGDLDRCRSAVRVCRGRRRGVRVAPRADSRRMVRSRPRRSGGG